jgi:hypothetical protein
MKKEKKEAKYGRYNQNPEAVTNKPIPHDTPKLLRHKHYTKKNDENKVKREKLIEINI